VAKALVVEADGIWNRLHLVVEQWQKYKMEIVREGWEPTAPDGKRLQLKGKVCRGGNLPTDAFWDRGVITLANY